MNKEFVNYNQALTLKKLGFDDSTLYVYADENTHRLQCGAMNYPTDLYPNYIRAPLHQQAFRFFREKRDLNHTICIVAGLSYGIWIHQNRNSIDVGDKQYDTYEEAESACLDKLIELCKNK